MRLSSALLKPASAKIMLMHIVYSSVAVPSFHPHEIHALLKQSRKANGKRDISGMLLHVEGTFFQVLEGEPAQLDAAYAAIQRDVRHTRITQLVREPIAEREFGDWTMGFFTVDPHEVGELLGEDDFPASPADIARLNCDRVKTLLSIFGRRRWQSDRSGMYRVVPPLKPRGATNTP